VLKFQLKADEADHASAYGIARAYVRLGDKNHALDWLEKSLERKEERLDNIKSDPPFDSLRSDPSFQNILRQMNLL
jgi:hypothetical protein